ncbi:G patch domain-containing protein 1 [Desmophyllum pertusum]|uniref:G patch domain-containing protein 1 n=1 Tax=Desmophyllum pertusum TaxID=174260 RepID=A0A9W9Y8F3_9CNID|nr:G patch domain-containing protein 1 [Desmophyllum pertusum]
MAASDDEDFASFGTPFEPVEDDAPRKKAVPIHEQVVTDTEGRRRFHGAFTGGFSAGYFNSVGTKEGWQPATFVSSRSQKLEQRSQRPEDFMDDEDMGEFGIAPKRITTKEEFLSQGSELQNRRKRVVTSEGSEGIIPGGPLLQDLVVPVKMSVGVELLKKMGWKEGQGVGPRERRTKKKLAMMMMKRIFFAVGLLFAPKDVDVFTFTVKDDKHGLGYRGLDPSTALFGQDNWHGVDPISSRVGRKGISGEAFGIGAFEEADDNIYAVYRPCLTRTQNSELIKLLDSMAGQALLKKMPEKTHQDCPKQHFNFNCTHKFDDSKLEQKSTEDAPQKRKILTATDRGEMLGEEPLSCASKDKKRVQSVSKDVAAKPSSAMPSAPTSSSARDLVQKSWSSTHWAGHSSFKPFAKDSAKQARYEEFFEKQTRGAGISNSSMKEWEREREMEEFAHSASLYRPMNSTMSARFTTAKNLDDHRTVYEDVPAQESSDTSDQTQAATMKMFGKLTRDNFEWHPVNTLCKRFNIPNPYPGSHLVGVPKVRRPKFTLGDFIVPQESTRAITYENSSTSSNDDNTPGKLGTTSKSVGVTDGQPTPSESKSASSDLSTKTFVAPSIAASVSKLDIQPNEYEQDTTKEAQNEEVNSVQKRPGMDLFKAIFADSSSDESETSDEDGVGKDEVESESLSIQASESKPSEEASCSHVDLTIKESNFIRDHKTLDQGLHNETIEREKQRTEVKAKNTVSSEKVESSPDIFGPAPPPPSSRIPSSSHSLNREKHRVETAQNQPRFQGAERRETLGTRLAQNKEGSERRRRKDKRKDTNKRDTDSSDSEEEYRGSKHKRKHKEKKKHKHKHKSKHRGDEKERLDTKTKGKLENSSQSLEQTHVSDEKQILSKLKNLQTLKAGKRMQASDFM